MASEIEKWKRRLMGGRSSLDLIWGADECPTNAPTIVGAEPRGYSCFNGSVFSASSEERGPVGRLAEAMRDSEEGMWLALVEGSTNRWGLIQSDYSAFYEAHHKSYHRGHAWRDFYYRAIYVLLDQIDRQWAASDVRLHHPTAYEWRRPDLAPSVVDAISNLLYTRDLTTERIHFESCTVREPQMIQEAVNEIETERSNPERPAPRPISAEERDPADLGYGGPARVELRRVDVVSRSR